MSTLPIKSTRNYRAARHALDMVQRNLARNMEEKMGRQARPFPAWFWGIVQSKGPAGEADFADARYWVLESVPSTYLNTSAKTGKAPYLNDGSGNRTIQLIPDPLNVTHTRRIWVPATNLAELPADYTANGPASSSGTHNLTAGAIALVVCMPDLDNPVNKWYAFLPTTFDGGGVSPGQYQDQCYCMIAQNQPGWDFGPRAHFIF